MHGPDFEDAASVSAPCTPGSPDGVQPDMPWTPEEQQRLRDVALQTSIALERVRGRTALRESEDRYHALFNGIEEGFCIIEMRMEAGRPLDYCFIEVNQAFERQSTLVDAKGRWMRELCPTAEERWFEIYRDVALTGQPVRFEASGYALENRRFDVYAFRIGPPHHRRVGVLFKDMTERCRLEHALRRAQDELEHRVRERTLQLADTCAALERELYERQVAEQQVQALCARLVTVQEDERRSIARALHDQLAQQITALRMHVEGLRLDATEHPALLAQAGQVRALAEELDHRIDGLMGGLRPVSLGHLGLDDTIGNLVRDWSSRCGVRADFEGLRLDGLRLAPHVALHLYRIAEEALQNVTAHARATRVGVLVERHGARLVLIVEDNGRGFDEGGLTAGEMAGMGLVGMRARAALIGGELEIESSPGLGTIVYVRLEVDGPTA